MSRRRYGSYDPYAKSTQLSPLRMRWTEREDSVLLAHPDMTASELSRTVLTGRSAKAIQRRRDRIGRWSAVSKPMCARCGDRPVWSESPRARSMGLCKGCYLHEMEHRKQENRRANALRQSLFKERKRSS